MLGVITILMVMMIISSRSSRPTAQLNYLNQKNLLTICSSPFRNENIKTQTTSATAPPCQPSCALAEHSVNLPTLCQSRVSLVAQLVKNLPAMQETTYNAGDLGLIPGSGRSPGGGNGNPLQYSCLGNPIDRRAWQATGYGITRVGHDLATK